MKYSWAGREYLSSTVRRALLDSETHHQLSVCEAVKSGGKSDRLGAVIYAYEPSFTPLMPAAGEGGALSMAVLVWEFKSTGTRDNKTINLLSSLV